MRKKRTDRQKMIAKLDALFSEYIRKRAIKEVHGCQRCLAWKPSWQDLQCAHLQSRNHHSTRWHEWAAIGLCGGCHRYIDSHAELKIEFSRKILGDENYERLYIEAQIRSHHSAHDYKLIEIYLRQLLQEV